MNQWVFRPGTWCLCAFVGTSEPQFTKYFTIKLISVLKNLVWSRSASQISFFFSLNCPLDKQRHPEDTTDHRCWWTLIFYIPSSSHSRISSDQNRSGGLSQEQACLKMFIKKNPRYSHHSGMRSCSPWRVSSVRNYKRARSCRAASCWELCVSPDLLAWRQMSFSEVISDSSKRCFFKKNQ